MVRIGIPRALLYYQYYPMWRTFFEALGAEVVVSPATNQAVLQAGAARVVADTCLPAKVFIGHALALVERCDFIFVPSVRSVRKRAYNCAKLLGLPDMTHAAIGRKAAVLDIDVDLSKGRGRLYRGIYQLGSHFAWNPLRIRRAAIAAWQAHLSYQEEMRLGLTPAAATDGMTKPDSAGSESPGVAVIGHPYMVYDEHVNHRLLTRLRKAGYRVLTPEMVRPETLEAATIGLVGREYWSYEGEVVGAGGHYLEAQLDGVIGVMAFGCGPDSLMMDMVRRQAGRLKGTPFMCLTLDEHAAEAGIVTRLEAFLDMIARRKRSPARLCV